MQVDIEDSSDLAVAGAAREMIGLQQERPGQFTVDGQYDRDEILELRAEYNQRREPEGITSDMIFGGKGEITSEMRNFGVAIGWGGLPKEGAVYPMPKIVPSTHPQQLILENVPMDAGSFFLLVSHGLRRQRFCHW